MSVHFAQLGLEISRRTLEADQQLSQAATSLRDDIRTIESQALAAASELEAATGSGGPLQHALDQQQKNMQAFKGTVEGLVDGQGSIVERLSVGCAKVEAVRSDMNNLSHEANMLAINTAISAAQLGARGATIGCVARNMQDLSAEVAAMSSELAERVTELREQLPSLEASSERLLADAAAFGEELNRIQGDFSTVTARVNEGLTDALGETRTRIAELRQDSQVASKHLNGLDKLFPKLNQLKQLGMQLMFLGSADDIRAALTGEVPAAAGEEEVVSFEEEDDGGLDAGEVLFF